jgi:hypothetical protein
MERLPAYARRACARAREWALPDMARGIASLGVALLLALAAYLAAGETGLIVGLVVGLAQVIVLFGGGFVVFLVGIVRHPPSATRIGRRTRMQGVRRTLSTSG